MSAQQRGERDQLALVLAVVLVLVIVAGGVVLIALHEDLTAYSTILAGPLVTGLVGLLLSKRVAVVQQFAAANRADVVEIKRATNGVLGTRLDSIDSALADAAVERGAHAADAADAAQAATDLREQ